METIKKPIYFEGEKPVKIKAYYKYELAALYNVCTKINFFRFLLALQPLHLMKIWFPSSELHSASFSWQLKSFASFYLNRSHLLPLHLLKRIISLNQATTFLFFWHSFTFIFIYKIFPLII